MSIGFGMAAQILVGNLITKKNTNDSKKALNTLIFGKINSLMIC